MGRYSASARRAAHPEKEQVAPIWRGIGCLMIVIIPVVSYMLASLAMTLAVQAELPMPYQFIGNPVLPPVLFRTGLAPIAGFLAQQENLYGILALTVLFIVIIGGIVSVVYAAIYRVVGPPRYGPLDAETPRINVKRYKR